MYPLKVRVTAPIVEAEKRQELTERDVLFRTHVARPARLRIAPAFPPCGLRRGSDACDCRRHLPLVIAGRFPSLLSSGGSRRRPP